MTGPHTRTHSKFAVNSHLSAIRTGPTFNNIRTFTGNNTTHTKNAHKENVKSLTPIEKERARESARAGRKMRPRRHSSVHVSVGRRVTAEKLPRIKAAGLWLPFAYAYTLVFFCGFCGGGGEGVFMRRRARVLILIDSERAYEK